MIVKSTAVPSSNLAAIHLEVEAKTLLCGYFWRDELTDKNAGGTMSFLLTPSVLASAPPLFSSLVPPLLTPDAPEWCRPSRDALGFSLCYGSEQDFAFVPAPQTPHHPGLIRLPWTQLNCDALSATSLCHNESILLTWVSPIWINRNIIDRSVVHMIFCKSSWKKQNKHTHG